jgi:hypothetical protein
MMIVGGTLPSMSLGSTSVLSIARRTVSSHAVTPLPVTSFLATIVPSGATLTSTVAAGLPAIVVVRTMFGLTRALMRPA